MANDGEEPKANQESWDGLDIGGKGMSGMSWDIGFDQATSRREHLDAVVRRLLLRTTSLVTPTYQKFL